MSAYQSLLSSFREVKAASKNIYQTSDQGLRLNVGCGATPTSGWRNYDNSPSLRNSIAGVTISALCRFGVLKKTHMKKLNVANRHNVKWADVSQKIPEKDGSVEVIYTSHMLEHLHRGKAINFVKEAYRVLQPRGILRISVPDLKSLVYSYIDNQNADELLHRLNFYGHAEENLLFRINVFMFGFRGHNWMYDGNSLCRLLEDEGFVEAVVLQPGDTLIPSPGSLDLFERSHESVYVEAIKP